MIVVKEDVRQNILVAKVMEIAIQIQIVMAQHIANLIVASIQIYFPLLGIQITLLKITNLQMTVVCVTVILKINVDIILKAHMSSDLSKSNFLLNPEFLTKINQTSHSTN